MLQRISSGVTRVLMALVKVSAEKDECSCWSLASLEMDALVSSV